VPGNDAHGYFPWDINFGLSVSSIMATEEKLGVHLDEQMVGDTQSVVPMIQPSMFFHQHMCFGRVLDHWILWHV
jgi:hypothetical protein